MISKSLSETDKVSQNFLQKILADKGDKAIVVGLFGDLGSGKTTFSQALGRQLGVSETMTSPTFVIMKKYRIINSRFSTLVHIDAYRLGSGSELDALDFEEIQKNPDNLLLIEWPERVIDVLPTDLVRINFLFISENEREISF